MTERILRSATVPDGAALQRLDRVASELFPEFSRSRLQTWIRAGELTVDGELRRPKDKLAGGEELELDASLVEVSFGPEPVPLAVIHEDPAFVVIDKPVGLVVHPGAGNLTGTLMNGLLHRYPELGSISRAGIVHRLDKDTSGLLVVARTLQAQNVLVQQLQAHEVSRQYEAVVYGKLERAGRVDLAIARNPDNRLKMSVQSTGKRAVTHYRVLEAFPEHTHVGLALETGRTHQIRVHMQKLGFPLVGDNVYGGGFREPVNKDERLVSALRGMPRQALHARRLAFAHPSTGAEVEFESALPEDMARLLAVLEDCR